MTDFPNLLDLDLYKIKSAPPQVYYVPSHLTEPEEELLLRKIYSSPLPKWTQLSNRRLQNWGGLPHPKGMVREGVPEWLQSHMNRIDSLGIFGDNNKPNHVLVNEYLQGQGIMPHLDGPLFHPVITTINLGSSCLLDFYHKSTPTQKSFSLFLQPRSLLILTDECYENYLHGIEEVKIDIINDLVVNMDEAGVKIGEEYGREKRVSVTIRNVPKVSRIMMMGLKVK